MGAAEIILRVRDAATPALKAAERAAGGLTGAVDDANDKLSATGGRIKGWFSAQAASLKAAQASVADTSQQYTQLGRVMGWITGGATGLAKGAGAAALGIAAIGAAAVAAGAAVAALGVGAVVGLGAVVVIAKEAQARLDELSGVKEIQIAVSPSSQAAIDNVSTSIETMKALLDALVVTVAANVAPAISRVANVVVGFAVLGVDAIKTFTGEGGSLLEALASFIVNGFMRSFLLPVQGAQLMVKAMSSIAGALGLSSAAFDAADKGIDAFFNTLTENTITGVKAMIGMTGLAEATAEAEKAGAALNKRMQQQLALLEAKEKASKGATEAVKADTKAAEEASRIAAVNWFDQQIAAIKALQAELDRFTFLPGLQAEIDELAVSTAAAVTGMQRELRRVAVGARAQQATQAMGRLSSVSSLVGASPVGGAVMAGVNLVADAGKGGGIMGEAKTLLTDFTNGLQFLPQVIVDFTRSLMSELLPNLLAALPGFVTELLGAAGDIVTDVAAALPEIIKSIIGSMGTIMADLIRLLPELSMTVLKTFLDPGFWIDVGKAIIQGILDALKGVLGSIFGNKEKTGVFQRNGAIGQMIQDRRDARGYASGLDYVGRTGMAVIHEGEEIVRRGGSMSQASKSRLGGTGGDIYVSGIIAADEEALVRKLQDLKRRGFAL